jgi:hypothetical protein
MSYMISLKMFIKIAYICIIMSDRCNNNQIKPYMTEYMYEGMTRYFLECILFKFPLQVQENKNIQILNLNAFWYFGF